MEIALILTLMTLFTQMSSIVVVVLFIKGLLSLYIKH